MNRELKNIVLFFVLHFLLLIGGYFILHLLGLAPKFPSNENLLNWDAAWYSSIKEDGYSFTPNAQSNTGFFPLFPMLWKVLHLSAIGISVLNAILFAIGSSLMAIALNKTWKEMLVIVCLPSLFFFYIPYSEALFYLMGAMVLLGLHKNLMWLFYIALFLSCMVRPVLFFFIPAIIVVFLLKRNSGFGWVKLLISVSIIGAATALSFFIVGSSSNDFFAYTKSQIGNWDHSFSLPGFPLTTWRGYRMLWLDGLALFILGLIGLVIVKLLKFEAANIKRGTSYLNPAEIFASIGLIMSLFYVVFFHLEEDGRTSLMSLNRYVFCSPLLHFLILSYFGKMSLSKKGMIIPISAGILSIVLLGFPYTHVVGLEYSKSLLFLGGCLIMWLGYYVVTLKHKNQMIYSLIFYAFNIALQLYLFQSFLKGNWIG